MLSLALEEAEKAREKGEGSVVNILQNHNLNYFLEVVWENDEKCSKILTKFFKDRRG